MTSLLKRKPTLALAILLIAITCLALKPKLEDHPTKGSPNCCTSTTCTKNGQHKQNLKIQKACIFKSIFKEEDNSGYPSFKNPESLTKSLDDGIAWVLKAQQENGGWGAGLSSRQGMMDPHAVQTDPATSAMVGLALIRNKNTLNSGEQRAALNDLCDYLIKTIDQNKSKAYITQTRGTQIQVKLGQHIDAVISAQFLSNLKEKTAKNHPKYQDISKALKICVEKIQGAMDDKGKTNGGSWAGVLQSSMSTAALEAAEMAGASVNTSKLEQARNYQKSNYDSKTGRAKTDDGAGILLYSMSSSVRGAAKEARSIREHFEKAKKEGLIDKKATISVQNLEKMGYSTARSQRLNTAYKVYESAKKNAQRKDIMNGFGNNGGEEFISFLQTGESLILNKDVSWKTWFQNISGKMMAIQNENGSWNGHHCITSPAFCTATCLLILSIQNDYKILEKMGASSDSK